MSAKSVLRGNVWIGLILSAALLVGCGSGDEPNPSVGESSQTADFDGQKASLWVDEVLERIKEDEVSPPVASRILAYTGVGLYESTVDGMVERRRLGGQVAGLDKPPAPDDAAYDMATILHATQGHLTPLLFESEESREHLIEVAEQLLQKRHRDIDNAVWVRSANRGILIAETIASRVANDGYQQRRDADFYPPDFTGGWEPVDGEEPLEPNWKTIDPFVLQEADRCQPDRPVLYSTHPESLFYQQAQAVVDATPRAGSEEEEIATFWADDPGATSTPPGHWMALATQLLDERDLDLAQAVELYALLGMTGADAFISCWDEKYRSYLIRPVTYIQRHIDADWDTTIDTPPFPEYTSGHANISGASAVVMTEFFGEVSFEDRTHEDRGFEPRSFDNFDQAAEEAGQSRIYGGVHYPMGNQQGLDQGRCVAEQVLEGIELEDQ